MKNSPPVPGEKYLQKWGIFTCKKQVKEMTQEYMAHYNYDRDHQGLDNVTPSSVYFYRNAVAA
jgi:hypothetical protein